jgi:glucosamine kinase
MTERILIADSGSTKTDWRFIDQMGRIHQFSGQGLNPYFMEKEQMIEILDKELLPLLAPMIGKDSFRGYFYGAGCGSNANCERVTFALLSVFPEAEIQVYSDLLAAAHGLCGHSEGIAAILGTGMNSCLYDGKQIIEQLPSLGYVLGDEGSGAYIGKHLLADYLNRDMPSEMSKRFESRFSLSKDQILHAVYKESNPNRFLASFSKFIYQNISDTYCVELVAQGFRRFLDLHICRYEASSRLPVHCTGSVAFWYSNILRRVVEEKGLVLGRVLETPIAGLTLYYGG